MTRFLVLVVVVASVLSSVHSWDSDELELFDLVDEVSANFYSVVGVPQTSDARTIRQAFKNLSLKLHPDKNDAPDADIKFRQLVAVYEILRDPVKRKKYDEVLENGLPDWRHPVYYYRRVRKMGLFEMLIILFIIITIGQYIVSWAAYLEKEFTVKELVTAEKKRLLKKQKKGKLDGDMPDMNIEIPKPSILNTLPFQIPRFCWLVLTFIPVILKLIIKYYCERKHLEENYTPEKKEESEPDTCYKGPRRRRNINIPKFEGQYSTENGSLVIEENQEADDFSRKPIYGGFWTDDDLLDLIKFVNKYPPGCSNRWEKISDSMGRSIAEVNYVFPVFLLNFQIVFLFCTL